MESLRGLKVWRHSSRPRHNLTQILLKGNGMLTTKLSSRGQLVIPKQVRDAHQWSENTGSPCESRDDGIFLAPLATKAKSRPLSALIGALPPPNANFLPVTCCASHRLHRNHPGA